MTVDQIVAELDDHGFADVGSTRKVAAINDAYWDISSREPWPFLEKTVDQNTVAGNSEFTNLPADFSKAIAVVIPANNRLLIPERLDTVTKNYDLAATGIPGLYYFIGEKMHFWRIPDAVYSVRLRYVAWPAALAAGGAESTIMLPVRHHRALALGALARLYAMRDDVDLAEVFNSELERRIKNMREDLHRKQYDRPDRILDITVDDYWEDAL